MSGPAKPSPYGDAYPWGTYPREDYTAEGGAHVSPEIAALRAARSGTATPSPEPVTSPSPLCDGCAWHIGRGRLEGECRKIAITATPWAAIAGMPATTPGAARWQARADAEAQEAAAYRSGERTTCAARQARVGVVG